MKHLKRFNENIYDSIFNREESEINPETKINDFLQEFRNIVNYDEDEFEQGDEPSMTDILSEVGDLCNKFEMTQEELKNIIDNGDDIDGILKNIHDYSYEPEGIKEYTEEDIKNFGLWLGDNLRKNKNRTIDELFDEWKRL